MPTSVLDSSALPGTNHGLGPENDHHFPVRSKASSSDLEQRLAFRSGAKVVLDCGDHVSSRPALSLACSRLAFPHAPSPQRLHGLPGAGLSASRISVCDHAGSSPLRQASLGGEDWVSGESPHIFESILQCHTQPPHSSARSPMDRGEGPNTITHPHLNRARGSYGEALRLESSNCEQSSRKYSGKLTPTAHAGIIIVFRRSHSCAT